MKAVALVALFSACNPQYLRSTGIVTTTGGALLVAAPLMNGDRLGLGTTLVGTTLVMAGVAAIVGSFYVDEPAKVCRP